MRSKPTAATRAQAAQQHKAQRLPLTDQTKPLPPTTSKSASSEYASNDSSPRFANMNNNNNNDNGVLDCGKMVQSMSTMASSTNYSLNTKSKLHKTASEVSTQACSPTTSFQQHSRLKTYGNEIENEYTCFEIKSKDRADCDSCNSCGCGKRSGKTRVCWCDSCWNSGCSFKKKDGKLGFDVDVEAKFLPRNKIQLPHMIHPSLETSGSIVGFDGTDESLSKMFNLTDMYSSHTMLDELERYPDRYGMLQLVGAGGAGVAGMEQQAYTEITVKTPTHGNQKKETLRQLRYNYRKNYSKGARRGYWLTLIEMKQHVMRRKYEDRQRKMTRTRKYARDCKESLRWGKEFWVE